MSKEYPCVYYDNGKCKKFEEPGYTEWCLLGPCGHETPSNADHIRGMTDNEMARELIPLFEEIFEDGIPSPEWFNHWLQQPYEEGENDLQGM